MHVLGFWVEAGLIVLILSLPLFLRPLRLGNARTDKQHTTDTQNHNTTQVSVSTMSLSRVLVPQRQVTTVTERAAMGQTTPCVIGTTRWRIQTQHTGVEDALRYWRQHKERDPRDKTVSWDPQTLFVIIIPPPPIGGTDNDTLFSTRGRIVPLALNLTRTCDLRTQPEEQGAEDAEGPTEGWRRWIQRHKKGEGCWTSSCRGSSSISQLSPTTETHAHWTACPLSCDAVFYY